MSALCLVRRLTLVPMLTCQNNLSLLAYFAKSMHLFCQDADLSGCRFNLSSHPDPQYVELTPHLVIGPSDLLTVSSSNSPDAKCYFDDPSCSCGDLFGVSLFERFLASSPYALVLKKIAHFLYNLPTDTFKPNATCRIGIHIYCIFYITTSLVFFLLPIS